MGGVVIAALSCFAGALLAQADPVAGLAVIVGGGLGGTLMAWIELS